MWSALCHLCTFQLPKRHLRSLLCMLSTYRRAAWVPSASSTGYAVSQWMTLEVTKCPCPWAVGVDLCINGSGVISKSDFVPISSRPFATWWVSALQLSFWPRKNCHRVLCKVWCVRKQLQIDSGPWLWNQFFTSLSPPSPHFQIEF